MSKPKELGWHFLSIVDGKPQMRDGGKLPKRNMWLTFEGEVRICESGLHASRRPWDALCYSPGNYITRVQLDGIVTEQADKLVCSRRKVLWGFDAEQLLHEFGRNQALGVLDKWTSPVPDVVRQYLETGDAALRPAARSAAWSAAESAARSAAWSAAKSAAESAARSAAWSAAESAARSAAESAAKSAAESAAWSAARSAAWSAAESAARSAARSAALDRANELLEQMLHDEAKRRGLVR